MRTLAAVGSVLLVAFANACLAPGERPGRSLAPNGEPMVSTPARTADAAGGKAEEDEDSRLVRRAREYLTGKGIEYRELLQAPHLEVYPGEPHHLVRVVRFADVGMHSYVVYFHPDGSITHFWHR